MTSSPLRESVEIVRGPLRIGDSRAHALEPDRADAARARRTGTYGQVHEAPAHRIPLPDATAASISTPPACPPVAVLPEPIIVATLVWPSPPAQRPVRLRAHPPDPVPRLVRSVVLTC